MAATIKSLLARGETAENYGHTAKFFETGTRRARRRMCDGCKHGLHALCESEACPCVCNDSDFRWKRSDAGVAPDVTKLTSDAELARVLTVRPELRPLFFR